MSQCIYLWVESYESMNPNNNYVSNPTSFFALYGIEGYHIVIITVDSESIMQVNYCEKLNIFCVVSSYHTYILWGCGQCHISL